jgi:sugar lactone lactonase YvrE
MTEMTTLPLPPYGSAVTRPPASFEAELAVDARTRLAEGPVWDAAAGVLRWTDIPGRRLHRYDPAAHRHDKVEVERQVGALVPRASGGLLLAVEGGFAAYSDGDAGALELLVPVDEDRKDLRFNDGKCDPAGRMYASTMSLTAEAGAGTLWRLDPDLSVHPLVDGLTIGNGLAWTADGATMYFIDSMSHRVDVFTVDRGSGDLSDRRGLVDVPESVGLPDGMCVDDEGCLWVALFGGGALRRYSPLGELLAVISVPAANVTSVAFGGPGLDELYITTARGADDESTRAAEPYAGGIFRARPGVTGPPPMAFAG